MLEKLLQKKKLNKCNESKHPMPSLIILTRDVRPSTIFSHIPIFAHFLKVPVLILPGKASIEFGRLFGIKSIAAIMFLSGSTIQSEGTDEEELDAQMDVDSFVNFAISKIPKK
jgi:ribosomal protein L7Ae-like RNA K-turn-binding protein